MSTAYVNGRFLPLEEATIPVTDRAFLFGDGVYEVIPIYAGRPFRLSAHLARLQRSLEALHIANPLDDAQWRALVEALATRNGGGDLSLYLQISRGAPPTREHGFPALPVTPTVVGFCQPLKALPDSYLRDGIAAVTLPDERWAHCDIKSTALLANVLLKERAYAAGAVEAILIRGGQVTEGASSNVFAVVDGVACTPPQDQHILPGVTRDLVLELAREQRLPARFAAVSQSQLQEAEEVWVCSSTRELLPVTTLDGAAVGDGRPGALWQRFHQCLQAYRQTFTADGTAAATARR